MPQINLYITKNSVGTKNAGIALLEQGNFKKAIVKCFSTAVAFDVLFDEAIANLKKPCDIALFTNCKPFDVDCAILREKMKGLHNIVFVKKQGEETLDWLRFVAYEIALNQGADNFLLKEAMSEVLK